MDDSGLILVVDDDDDIRRMLKSLLMEFVVETASNLKEAKTTLDRGLKGLPLVVLLDVMLAGEDGRKLLEHPSIRSGVSKVILVTGMEMANDEKVECIYQGIPVIRKPFSVQHLEAHVWACAQIARERRVLAEIADNLSHVSTGNYAKTELARIRTLLQKG